MPTNPLITSVLTRFGLTSKETKIFLILLELGPSLASTLQRRTRFPRTTVYTVLESLKKKGIISNLIQNKTTYFSSLDPEVLIERVDEKISQQRLIKSELESILPSLQNLTSKFASKPKVHFFEGEKGIKSLYENTLKNKNDELLIFVTVEELPQELANYLRQDYIKKRLANKIKTKAIVSRSKAAERYQQTDQKSLRESIIMPEGSLPFESEVCLYDKNKIAIISFKDDLVGIRIKNEALYNTLKALFDLIWKSKTLN